MNSDWIIEWGDGMFDSSDEGRINKLLDDLGEVEFERGFLNDLLKNERLLNRKEALDKLESARKDSIKRREEIRESIMAYFKEKRYE